MYIFFLSVTNGATCVSHRFSVSGSKVTPKGVPEDPDLTKQVIHFFLPKIKVYQKGKVGEFYNIGSNYNIENLAVVKKRAKVSGPGGRGAPGGRWDRGEALCI